MIGWELQRGRRESAAKAEREKANMRTVHEELAAEKQASLCLHPCRLLHQSRGRAHRQALARKGTDLRRHCRKALRGELAVVDGYMAPAGELQPPCWHLPSNSGSAWRAKLLSQT